MPRHGNVAVAKPPSNAGRVVRRIILLLLALLVIVAAFFVWNRWLRYDDAADLQGVWIDQNGTQLAFDGQRMLLGNAVIYEYTLDPGSKTITYTFNDAKGYSAYRFSDDRSMLALRDVPQGGGTDWLMLLHIKEDPLREALNSSTDIPAGSSRFQRSARSVEEAFAAYKAQPSSIKDLEVGGIVWPENKTSSNNNAEGNENAAALGGETTMGGQEIVYIDEQGTVYTDEQNAAYPSNQDTGYTDDQNVTYPSEQGATELGEQGSYTQGEATGGA